MLPNFVVIGGMKCGTTALWHYLLMHPEIFVPKNNKNLNFFIEDDNWSKGIDWYQSYFSSAAEKTTAVGEISTEYTKYPVIPGVPARMVSVLPAAKLIYLVRHPIKRIVSHYIHRINTAEETRTIDDALEDLEHNRYLFFSMYHFQLEQFLPYYPNDRITLVLSEDLKSKPVETLNALFAFLGVSRKLDLFKEVVAHTRYEKRAWNRLGRVIRRSTKLYKGYRRFMSRVPSNLRPLLERAFCRSVPEPQMTENTRNKLTEALNEDVEKLSSFAGRQLWKLDGS